MSGTTPSDVPNPDGGGRRDVVNDFSLVVATVNGTGSQTANLAVLRALFSMGIPVHGKNIFPSNIQGLPTWYHIRVSRDGYVARTDPELLVAFNQQTIDADLRELPSGGVAIVNADLAPPSNATTSSPTRCPSRSSWPAPSRRGSSATTPPT
jgi:Pyruvate/2-oxoacid:ferredoxin oxidoreductase gamma subunit